MTMSAEERHHHDQLLREVVVLRATVDALLAIGRAGRAVCASQAETPDPRTIPYASVGCGDRPSRCDRGAGCGVASGSLPCMRCETGTLPPSPPPDRPSGCDGKDGCVFRIGVMQTGSICGRCDAMCYPPTPQS